MYLSKLLYSFNSSNLLDNFTAINDNSVACARKALVVATAISTPAFTYSV